MHKNNVEEKTIKRPWYVNIIITILIIEFIPTIFFFLDYFKLFELEEVFGYFLIIFVPSFSKIFYLGYFSFGDKIMLILSFFVFVINIFLIVGFLKGYKKVIFIAIFELFIYFIF